MVKEKFGIFIIISAIQPTSTLKNMFLRRCWCPIENEGPIHQVRTTAVPSPSVYCPTFLFAHIGAESLKLSLPLSHLQKHVHDIRMAPTALFRFQFHASCGHLRRRNQYSTRNTNRQKSSM